LSRHSSAAADHCGHQPVYLDTQLLLQQQQRQLEYEQQVKMLELAAGTHQCIAEKLDGRGTGARKLVGDSVLSMSCHEAFIWKSVVTATIIYLDSQVTS
jgi:hypothetical protein